MRFPTPTPDPFRPDRAANRGTNVYRLCLALVFLTGCDAVSPAPSPPVAVRPPVEMAPLQPEALDDAPAPLQRVAPPALVQLTEFNEETAEEIGPADRSDRHVGPELALPQRPASARAASAQAGRVPDDNNVFAISEQDIATHSEPDTLLPWGPSTPSPELAAILDRAEEIARRGYDLAERGALYSARARFVESLRTVAQALDTGRKTTAHSRALAAGMRAMEEVDDFVSRGTQMEADLNMRLIVDAHRTPVLKARPLEDITSVAAQRMYLTYAQEQLAAAGGDQPVASLALHGLGKICTTPTAMHGPREPIAEAKAVVFFQAALVVEPRNFMSANELGVLLARFGRWDDARSALEQAVAQSGSPATWRNLAEVHERIGDRQKAAHCRQQADMAIARLQQSGQASASSRYPVQWVDPASFAQTSSMVADASPDGGGKASAVQAPPATAAKPEAKSGGFKWPWQ